MSELFAAEENTAPQSPEKGPEKEPGKDLGAASGPADPYLVLARKYRPQNFTDLIGQQALVQTLQNAIEADRIHHAYVLTGIRGVGKTTTARILAMALNCDNGPATTWDENDPQCTAIAGGNHVDVLEYDAASHTGVDDVRSLFEGVGYQPVQGRYKIYIIDEVHMLSKQAFNALLKTLEEPPAHVKFIFATTEVNKIPVTVLSRCQRFDLKRVRVEELEAHFKNICAQENVKIADAAIGQIARAADGSVRDGLSLLDQAIALSGNGEISEQAVADMLGQADTVKIFNLLERVLSGQAADALAQMKELYHNGNDPLLLAQDMLRGLHLLTRLNIVPDLKNSPELSEAERTQAAPMADKFPLDGLGRAYQMLLTGVEEAKKAPRPVEAIEMALVRIAYLAPVPALETLLRDGPPKTETQAEPQAETQDKKEQAQQQHAAASQPEPGEDAAGPAPWDDDSESAGTAPTGDESPPKATRPQG